MATGLCQPAGGASCGACCGLYNFADHSRTALTEALRRRTEHLRPLPRTRAAFTGAAAALRAQDRDALFTDVRICPLLGFLDADEARVGCLAHPLQNGGDDLRDCGVYNRSICADFECPSFLWLSDEEARLVREACPDWYVYGLVITDVAFVRGCLALIGRLCARTVQARELLSAREVLAEVAALFALKERAPGRQHGAAIFGRFVPDGEGDAALRTLDYAALGAQPAPEDDVVLCLGYVPRSRAALEAARRVVAARVERVASGLTSRETPPA